MAGWRGDSLGTHRSSIRFRISSPSPTAIWEARIAWLRQWRPRKRSAATPILPVSASWEAPMSPAPPRTSKNRSTSMADADGFEHLKPKIFKVKFSVRRLSCARQIGKPELHRAQWLRHRLGTEHLPQARSVRQVGAREAQAEFLQWRHLHLLDLLASLGVGHLLQIRRVSYHHKTINNWYILILWILNFYWLKHCI